VSGHLRNNVGRRRYELVEGDQVVAFVQYQREGDRLTLTHTQGVEGAVGRGATRHLVEELLADARRRDLAILPECPYVRRVIVDHPDRYLELVPADARARFLLAQ
jgi:predicted GNAT family acetyltransferase